MLSELKVASNSMKEEILQSPNSIDPQKGKGLSKSKKPFKIKKSKMYNSKKNLHEQIFTDPLYEGLQNQQNLNENRSNFGPWVHEDRKYLQSLELSKFKHQNVLPSHQQNFSRPIFTNEDYFESQIINTPNINGQEPHRLPQTNHLPEIKYTKGLLELRFSSLALEIPKYSTLSPLKIQKNKYNAVMYKKSHSRMSIDILRCESMKNLPSVQTYSQLKSHSRPNNVIFNYCCVSSSQTNPFGSQLQEMGSKNLLNRNGNLNKTLLRDSFQSNLNGLKMKEIQNINSNKISPLKKTISEQLYAELLRKKNKRK